MQQFYRHWKQMRKNVHLLFTYFEHSPRAAPQGGPSLCLADDLICRENASLSSRATDLFWMDALPLMMLHQTALELPHGKGGIPSFWASHVHVICCHGCLECISPSAEVMQISLGSRHRDYRISPALTLLEIFKRGMKAHPSEAFADGTKEASRAELRRKAFPQLREYEFSFPAASLSQEQEMCAWSLLNGISGILCLCWSPFAVLMTMVFLFAKAWCCMRLCRLSRL